MSGSTSPLYESLDFFTLRVPVLPIETFDALGDGDLSGLLTEEARVAIAVASPSFIHALDDAADGAGPTLRRYLIRMSTRPTPFGLFAGAGVGAWGNRTDLMLASGPRLRRTRPDAAWLSAVAHDAESDPDVRRQLRVVANTSAFVRAGRVVLAERVSRGEAHPVPAVSVRATGVVRRALAAARAPIPYADLARLLLGQTPGATEERVDTLLGQLIDLTLLLTQLRPPLTVGSRAHDVVNRLAGIPEAKAHREALLSVIEAAEAWDAAPEATERQFHAVVDHAAAMAPFDRSPLQVDTGLALRGCTVSGVVAEEAARAAELLLRMSPMPRGPSRLDTYRRMFEHRYGGHREVPLLELLDADVGLGPPPSTSAAGQLPPLRSAARAQALLELATMALRDRTLSVELDGAALQRLETDDLSTANAPLSLELTVLVSAPSRQSVDAGDFELVIGPNVGSMGAGRMLGRFADFLPGAAAALERLAAREAALAPGRLMAELAYAPRSPRMANVSTRPNARRCEIAVGVLSGAGPGATIPVDELVVGIRDGRFCLRWAKTGEELLVTAGHMLSSTRAPSVCRFLSDLGRDGVCQLSGFQWGPAAAFPFLPQVRSGRVVLSLAQWRLRAGGFSMEELNHAPAFRPALERWRGAWGAPARLAIAAGDHRLPLDLSRAGDTEELRRALRRGPGPVVLTEILPDVESTWVQDGAGRRFAAELVVPLVRRVAQPAPPMRPAPAPAVDLRGPGSDWLFVKVYTGRDMEEDLLAGPVRRMVGEAATLGFADWFFIRYGDPGRHLRLRFRGDGNRLLAELLPQLSGWARALMSSGECRRVAFDTYEREIERFGGPAGTDAVEAFFAADSRAAIELLALRQAGGVGLEPLAVGVLTVDALLDGLGLDGPERAEWCGRRGGPRQESGADYRTWKGELRPLLAEPARVLALGGGERLAAELDRLRIAGAELGSTLEALRRRGSLTRPPTDLYGSVVHLHLNRLLAADHTTERRVLGLAGRLRAGLASQSR